MGEERESIWEHVGDLAHCAKVSIISVFVSSLIVSFIPIQVNPSYISLLEFALRKVQADLLPEGATLIASTWIDVLWVYILLALLLGFALASPVVAYEAYKFIAPALYPHEKRYAFWFIFPFILLFTLGSAFSYFLLLPLTYKILIKFVYSAGAAPLFSIMDFFSFTILVTLAVGLMFTFPVFTTLLVKMGVISPSDLASKRKEAIVGLLILTAVITPDTSGVTMIIFFIPLMALYELAILAGKIAYRK
jgi:sec-independent protein translocase protein TatC